MDQMLLTHRSQVTFSCFLYAKKDGQRGANSSTLAGSVADPDDFWTGSGSF
jgi:hypothetical protein